MPQRPRRLSLTAPHGGLARRLGGLDQRALRFLRTRGQGPRTERLARALGAFGEWGLGWTAVAAAVDGRRWRGWCSAVAVGRLSPALYGIAVAVCLGRPFLGMHYPSDLLAGVVLGRMIGRTWPSPAAGEAAEEVSTR